MSRRRLKSHPLAEKLKPSESPARHTCQMFRCMSGCICPVESKLEHSFFAVAVLKVPEAVVDSRPYRTILPGSSPPKAEAGLTHACYVTRLVQVSEGLAAAGSRPVGFRFAALPARSCGTLAWLTLALVLPQQALHANFCSCSSHEGWISAASSSSCSIQSPRPSPAQQQKTTPGCHICCGCSRVAADTHCQCRAYAKQSFHGSCVGGLRCCCFCWCSSLFCS